jgi:hypothetical protein
VGSSLFGRFAPLNVLLQNGDAFAIAAHPEAERLDAPFGIPPGDTVPIGSYTFLRYRIDYERASKRRVSWSFSFGGGGFFAAGGTPELPPRPGVRSPGRSESFI